MKLKKLIAIILIVFLIISANNNCFAKYVFEYTKKAAEIVIGNN